MTKIEEHLDSELQWQKERREVFMSVGCFSAQVNLQADVLCKSILD